MRTNYYSTDSSLECKTPDNLDGRCQSIENCQKLFSIYRNKLISTANKTLLKQSLCGSQDGIRICVCCAVDGQESFTTVQPKEETEENLTTEGAPGTIPEWLIDLKKKVPQAPDCGMHSHDRIFGGSKVEIGKHPWVVMLQFQTRKQNGKSIVKTDKKSFANFSFWQKVYLWRCSHQWQICYNRLKYF